MRLISYISIPYIKPKPFNSVVMTLSGKVSNNFEDLILEKHGLDVLNYIYPYLSANKPSEGILLDTSSILNLKSIRLRDTSEDLFFKSITNLKRLNDVKYVNKFLEQSNEVLEYRGVFIGHIETSARRKERILKKYPRPLNGVIYFFDFIIKRVFPKFKITKRVYFLLTQGRNRVMSRMEILGRLYSSGFELVTSKEINGKFWFIGKKVGIPAYNEEATYGPIIKLKRLGKGAKVISIYKLRTMYPYSEYLQSYISDKYGLQDGGKFRSDPRVTTLGRVFRKLWLDETPMLYNLLKGDVKIVGVRPLSKQYFNLYPKHIQELRLSVKPGLIPPFYVDLPASLEEICLSEEKYVKSYLKSPFKTDVKYFFIALYNILIKRARSS